MHCKIKPGLIKVDVKTLVGSVSSLSCPSIRSPFALHYMICGILIWLGLWGIVQMPSWFWKGCRTFGISALWACVLLHEQTLLPLLAGRDLQAHRLATASSQQGPKAFSSNRFILPVPHILQGFGKMLHKMESAI